MVVPVADARVDEDAVVVGAGDAALADVAVLGARRLDDVAGAADTARMKEGPVIWVEGHVVCEVVLGDVARIRSTSQVKEQIWEGDGYHCRQLGEPANLVPSLGQEHQLPNGHDEDEEYLTCEWFHPAYEGRFPIKLTTTVGCRSYMR